MAAPLNPLCVLGREFAHNVYYKILLYIRLPSCLLGIGLCGALLLTKLHSVVFHVHARILLKAHIFISLLLSVNFIAISILEVVRYTTSHNDPCGYLIPRWLTFTPHFVTANLVALQVCSSLFIVIERLICTYRLTSYENSNHRVKLYFGLIATVIIVFGIIYLMVGCTSRSKKLTYQLAYYDQTNYRWGSAVVFATLALEIVAIILCKLVDVINKKAKKNFLTKLNRRKNNLLNNHLSSKLQIRESINLSETLMPIIIVHFVFSAITNLVVALILVLVTKDLISQDLVMEWISLLFPLYAIVMPIMILRKHPSLMERFLKTKAAKIFKKMSTVLPKNNAFDDHFKQFDLMIQHKARK